MLVVTRRCDKQLKARSAHRVIARPHKVLLISNLGESGVPLSDGEALRSPPKHPRQRLTV